jgi:hypothetical protein
MTLGLGLLAHPMVDMVTQQYGLAVK